MKNKKRFISFLKANAVYELFLQNLKDNGMYNIHSLTEEWTVDDFLLAAFVWGDNIKDFYFWNDFQDVWEFIIKEEDL
jgi:hypothetical protein